MFKAIPVLILLFAGEWIFLYVFSQLLLPLQLQSNLQLLLENIPKYILNVNSYGLIYKYNH